MKVYVVDALACLRVCVHNQTEAAFRDTSFCSYFVRRLKKLSDKFIVPVCQPERCRDMLFRNDKYM